MKLPKQFPFFCLKNKTNKQQKKKKKKQPNNKNQSLSRLDNNAKIILDVWSFTGIWSAYKGIHT